MSFVPDKPNDVVDRRQLRVQHERGVGECNEVISGAIQQPRLPLYVHFYANILTHCNLLISQNIFCLVLLPKSYFTGQFTN